jgi:predicted peroxiredoxin
MRELLIVETRDAAEQRGPERMAELAAGMVKSGVPATIFLTENGAFAARRLPMRHLASAIAEGVEVAVDRFALHERAIGEDELTSGIVPADIEMIVDHLAAGSCIMWR